MISEIKSKYKKDLIQLVKDPGMDIFNTELNRWIMEKNFINIIIKDKIDVFEYVGIPYEDLINGNFLNKTKTTFTSKINFRILFKAILLHFAIKNDFEAVKKIIDMYEEETKNIGNALGSFSLTTDGNEWFGHNFSLLDAYTSEIVMFISEERPDLLLSDQCLEGVLLRYINAKSSDDTGDLLNLDNNIYRRFVRKYSRIVKKVERSQNWKLDLSPEEKLDMLYQNNSVRKDIVGSMNVKEMTHVTSELDDNEVAELFAKICNESFTKYSYKFEEMFSLFFDVLKNRKINPMDFVEKLSDRLQPAVMSIMLDNKKYQ